MTQKPDQVCKYLKKIGRFTSQATIAKVGRVEETPREEQAVISPLLDRVEMWTAPGVRLGLIRYTKEAE